jgi:hypothetical protein
MVETMEKISPTNGVPAEWPCKFAYVACESLFVDHEYQRAPNLAWVRRTAENFDPNLFGVLVASKRNGVYALVDGQQRWMVLKALGMRTAPCMYYEGKTKEEEARIFVAMNFDRKMVNAWYHYRALRFAGDERILDVEGIVQEAGFVVGAKAGEKDSIIQSPAALMSIYDGSVDAISTSSTLSGPEILARTLAIIDGAWGEKMGPGWRLAKSSSMIRGVARWVGMNPNTPTEDVIASLSKTTPVRVLDRAARLAEGGSGSSGKGRQIPKVIAAIVGKKARR